MSSEIQFGDLEHAQPELGIRPDRDAHFAVMPVGPIGLPDAGNAPEQDLMIFVDLDVMRDMEAHASSDTRVELGGVMLGKQHVDEQGRPFVVITDSLRAAHYQATKGSFTFTHDTWSQITRERQQHRPDLEMVGWYHTHPGWTVFLSGMDLFICNNFFNRPLDVALVIDPVNDDRGWFQWTDDARPVTRPTQGFYLMTNRYRQQELKYFSRLYSGPDMNVDPRYSEGAFGASSPVVNIMDNRRPLTDVAIIAMLTVQFLVLGLLAWKLMIPPGDAQIAEQDKSVNLQEAREEAYREILRTAVSTRGEDPNLVEKYTAARTDNARLLANLDGQLALAEKFLTERDSVQSKLTATTEVLSELQGKHEKTKQENEVLRTEIKKIGKEDGAAGEQAWLGIGYFWWWCIGGLFLAVGIAATFLAGHRKGKFDAYDELGEYDRRNESQSTQPVHREEEPENFNFSLTENQPE